MVTRAKTDTDAVATFLAGLDDARRADCTRLDSLMRAATGTAGTMYGASIVGYGTTTITYAGGREAPWMKMGFSPRKQALTLYGLVEGSAPALLAAIGPHSTGKDCLYIKRMHDVDERALAALMAAVARR